MSSSLADDVELFCQHLLDDGSVVHTHFPVARNTPQFQLQKENLCDIGDSFASLTCLTFVDFCENDFSHVPDCMFRLPQLESLRFPFCKLLSLSPAIGHLTQLVHLHVQGNRLRSLPHEIGRCRALQVVIANNNQLTSLPSSLGELSALTELDLSENRLSWLPLEFERLPTNADFFLFLFHNQLPVAPRDWEFTNWRPLLQQVFDATTHVGMIRERIMVICVGLAELELPALVTLEIVDAACPNNCRMAAKWDVILAAKHFRDLAWHWR